MRKIRNLSNYSMPVLKFDKKVKAAKIEAFNEVLPTIFKADEKVIKGKVTDLYTEDDITDDIFQLIQGDKRIKINWVQVHEDIYAYLEDLSKNEIRVVRYIIKKIKPQSNKIEFDYEEMSKLFNIAISTCIDAVSDLTNRSNNQIISKTTIKGLFVINHKLIFKGDYEKFMKRYYTLYDGEPAKLDDKGRIIIEALK